MHRYGNWSRDDIQYAVNLPQILVVHMAGIQDQEQLQHLKDTLVMGIDLDHHHEDHSIWHKEGASAVQYILVYSNVTQLNQQEYQSHHIKLINFSSDILKMHRLSIVYKIRDLWTNSPVTIDFL